MPKTRLRDYLVLLLAVWAGYWFLFVYAAQNDFLDCWLPWRHFASKSFQNGIFPLWNPYQQLGYPAYADLQGPVLSFENFITGSWLKLDLTTLQIIFFGYVYLAAIGMYELGRYLYQHRLSSIVIAIAYVCGSFFIHHQQHFFSIISAACAPLSLVLMLKFFHQPLWKYIWPLVVLFHLQFTSGNQTFNLINIHVLLVLFLLRIKHLYRLDSAGLKKLLLKTGYLFLLILLVLLPVFIAYWQTKSEVARYAGMTYEKATALHMTWPSFWSYLNPFVSGAPISFTQTDPAMAGHFIGWGILICAAAYFLTSTAKLKWAFLSLIVVFSLLALGPLTPVHRFIFNLDPLLQMFRFPAYYMFYVNFILLLAAGFYLKVMFTETHKLKTLVYGYLILVGLVLVSVLVFGWDKGHVFYDLRTGNGFTALKHLSPAQLFSFALLILLMFASLYFSLILIRKNNPRRAALFLSVELLLVSNLSIMQIGSGRTTTAIDAFMQNRTLEFSTPPTKLHSSHDLLDQLPPDIWRNYHTFLNVVSPDFFNSFYLEKITHLDSTTSLRDSLYTRPLWSVSVPATVTCLRFEPNTISFQVNTPKACQLNVMQMNHRYWTLEVNKRPQSIPAQSTLACILNGKGNYTVTFTYSNDLIMYFIWISWLVVFICLVFALKCWLQSNAAYIGIALLVVLFFGAVLKFLL